MLIMYTKGQYIGMVLLMLNAVRMDEKLQGNTQLNFHMKVILPKIWF